MLKYTKESIRHELEQKWSKGREVEIAGSAQWRKTGVQRHKSCCLEKQEKSEPCAQRCKIGAHGLYVEKNKKFYF